MPFTFLDGILALVVLISAVLAMIRGFTREVFSIASWVAAAAAAYFLWERALPFTERYIDDRNVAMGVTIAGIFFITLILVSVITMRLSDFVLDSRAGPLDRTLGFLFGAARGLVLMIVAFLFLNFFIAEDRQPQWIADAASKPWLEGLGEELMNQLPEDPERRAIEYIQGVTGRPSEQPGTTTPAPEGEAPPTQQQTTPEPGISPDDQNELERQLEELPSEG
jgi:membrane protein required for colicin V production